MLNKSAKKIRIVAISGSVRPGSLTTRAVNLVADEIRKNKNIHLDVIDPSRINLTLPGLPEDAGLEKLRNAVSGATGVILATPEYHGSYSSVIKLVIDNLGFPSVLSGKPVALLGVASGQIGAIKALEHLRSVCSHVGAIVLPSPVSVAGAHKFFNDDGRCTDPKMEEWIRGLGTRLIGYIHKHICPGITLEEMVRGDAEPRGGNAPLRGKD